MVFRLRLAERQLRLDLTDHDPNLPQEVWPQVGGVAAGPSTSTSSLNQLSSPVILVTSRTIAQLELS